MAEPTEEERQAMLDLWTRMNEAREKEKSTVQFVPVYPVYPGGGCPCCGYCPHCGRGGHHAYPGIGYPPSITYKTVLTGTTS